MRCKDCHIYKTHVDDIKTRLGNLCSDFEYCFRKRCGTDEIQQLCLETATQYIRKWGKLVSLRDTKCPESGCILLEIIGGKMAKQDDKKKDAIIESPAVSIELKAK